MQSSLFSAPNVRPPRSRNTFAGFPDEKKIVQNLPLDELCNAFPGRQARMRRTAGSLPPFDLGDPLLNGGGGSASSNARPRSGIQIPRRWSREDTIRARGSSLDNDDSPSRLLSGDTLRHSHSFRSSSADIAERFGSRPSTIGDTERFGKDSQEVQKHLLKTDIEKRQQQFSTSRRPGLAVDKRLERTEREDVPEKRLLIVSSRLPLTIIFDEESGTFSREQASLELLNVADIVQAARSDGMGSGIFDDVEVILVGMPVVRKSSDGSLMSITEESLQQELVTFLTNDLKALPVFLPPDRDKYARWVMFPLFHYSPPSVENGLGLYDWEGYELINKLFQTAIITKYRRGDIVWITDYALMLLPKMLRNERPDIHIGYYMNCVFPSSEVYRILPQREELLRGVLSANLIGFHNFQYVRHFLTSCTRVLGLECSASSIEACEDAGGTSTKVIAMPLGIDPKPYESLLEEQQTFQRIDEFDKIFSKGGGAGKKILVSLDRLEEKKGIPHKIMAFHKFLQKEPSWATSCVFVLIVDPPEDTEETSEATIDERQRLLQQIYQMVGEVNSKFGTIGHLPVHFLYQEFKAVAAVDIVALIVNADVMIDAPLRDMMSRSAHLFLCCQDEKRCGVLILSEFSGSAQSLRAAALCVNPWDTSGFADAMQEALEMEERDKVDLHRYGQRHVTQYTIQKWAMNFLDELETAVEECEQERLAIPPLLNHERAVDAFHKASRRLVILGFSGTLLPRKSRIASKIMPRMHDVLESNLQVIAEEDDTHVVVVSGFPRDTLTKALRSIKCWIVAEGGLCYRVPGSTEWINTEEQRDTEWLEPVKGIMEYFAARTPGSTVIHTSCSVSWHYQKTQGDHAAIQSKDMLIHLWAGPLMSAPAEVVVGNDSVSVRPTGVSKASCLEGILKRICCEDGADKPVSWMSGDSCVMCISDLLMRDEDVFVTVQKFFESEKENTEERRSPTLMTLDPRDNMTWDEETNLEMNSRSLDMSSLVRREPGLQVESLFGNLNRSSDEGDRGPLDLLFSAEDGNFENTMKKSPSESDLDRAQVGDAEVAPFDASSDSEDKVSLFTCTINRKATRANFHLCDTSDVAFLIAQFARRLRQGEKEFQVQAQASSNCYRQASKSPVI